MRMWDIDPKIMCRKHLMGEHVEMHMFVGTINRNISIKGYLENNLLDVKKIKERHDIVSDEMIRRGYHHKSELKDILVEFDEQQKSFYINKEKSLNDLLSRCPECRKNYETLKIKQEVN